MQEKGLPWGYIIPAIVMIIVIIGLIYVNYANHSATTSSLNAINIPTQTPQSLSDVPFFCDQPTGCAYHWHVHLDIFVGNTSYVVVPAVLGRVDNTLYALHTHDSSGVIHIETGSNQIFTCGQICEVWGYPTCSATDCLTYHNQQVRTYVNGTAWTGDPSSIPLHQHDEIAIVIGSPLPANIPSSYSFPAGE